jgi:hypothetical protein
LSDEAHDVFLGVVGRSLGTPFSEKLVQTCLVGIVVFGGTYCDGLTFALVQILTVVVIVLVVIGCEALSPIGLLVAQDGHDLFVEVFVLVAFVLELVLPEFFRIVQLVDGSFCQGFSSVTSF